MARRFVDLEDAQTRIDAAIDYAKLTGRHEKVQSLIETREMLDQVPYIDVPVNDHNNTILYRYTEERE